MRTMRFLASCVVVMIIAKGLPAQVNASRLVIDDPRPLAKAAEKLENVYHWVITYEDPRWVVPTETVDVTDRVRRDIGNTSQGMTSTVQRVLIPKGGTFTFSLPEVETSNIADRLDLLRQLIVASSSAGNPGRFRVFQSDGVFHITPDQQEDANMLHEPLLDARISIPQKDWTGAEILEAVCEELSNRTGQHVVLGVIPLNPFAHHHASYGASETVARDFLSSILDSIGRGYSWQLFFDPGVRMYALNIHRTGRVPHSSRTLR